MSQKFTPAHEAELRLAVNNLNETLKRVLDECGDSVSIRPWANFSTDDGFANIEVEITTGRIRIGQR